MCWVKKCKHDSCIIWLGRELCIDHWFRCCRLGKLKFLKKYDKNFNAKYEREIMARELREFVEDMLSNGRTTIQILAVAENSCWRGKKDDIIIILNTFTRKMKKEYTECAG